MDSEMQDISLLIQISSKPLLANKLSRKSPLYPVICFNYVKLHCHNSLLTRRSGLRWQGACHMDLQRLEEGEGFGRWACRLAKKV